MAAKTYTLLSTMPTGNGPGQTPIKQCSALLENKLQCWNASSFIVKTMRSGKPFEYQLCRRHAMIEQALPPEAVKALDTTSDAATVKVEEKTASRVVSDSTSSFKPAPAKITDFPIDKTDAFEERQDREKADVTPAAKPLLAPKTPKPAAF